MCRCPEPSEDNASIRKSRLVVEFQTLHQASSADITK